MQFEQGCDFLGSPSGESVVMAVPSAAIGLAGLLGTQVGDIDGIGKKVSPADSDPVGTENVCGYLDEQFDPLERDVALVVEVATDDQTSEVQLVEPAATLMNLLWFGAPKGVGFELISTEALSMGCLENGQQSGPIGKGLTTGQMNFSGWPGHGFESFPVSQGVGNAHERSPLFGPTVEIADGTAAIAPVSQDESGRFPGLGRRWRGWLLLRAHYSFCLIIGWELGFCLRSLGKHAAGAVCRAERLTVNERNGKLPER